MFGFVRLIFSPITALIFTPVRLLQTAWNCLTLLRGKWHQYPHFNAHTSFTTLFYWTRALNLYRYGRRGISPYLGLGAYNLSRGFHYSLASLFAFWKAGTVVMIVGIFGWLGSFYLWNSVADISWIMIIMGTILISTLFYTNAFHSQNYNILGWCFFPTIVLGIMTQDYYLVAGAIFLSSFGSFTVVFISTLIVLAVSAYTWSLTPLLSALPACAKLLTHFYPFLFIKATEGSNIFGSVLKAIGLSRRSAKYKRKAKSAGMGMIEWYFLLLTIQFAICYYFLTNQIPILLLVGMSIYVLNSVAVRFADHQSALMMIFTLVVAYAILSNNPLILISLWLVISPLPLLIGYEYDLTVLDIVPAFRPFSMSGYLDKMANFFTEVKEDEKVLMAFEDPQGVYEGIFSGYRQLIELPSYVANQKHIHFFPEFWTVFEVNYEGAPQIWGREVEEVKTNMKYWKADFVIIYQEDAQEIDPKWEIAGFTVQSTYDWSEHADDFKNHKRIRVDNLRWWLLRYES